MAEVWMGRRVASGGASKSVAIKLLAAKHADNLDFRRMFHDEARLTMLLTNSNIVQVFDVGEDNGELYMAMEWVDGLNLSQLTKRVHQAGEHLAPVISVYIVAELLRALSYAHGLVHEGVRTEVVHRDISPQNVMLSVAGEVKLMDFGIARLSTEDTSGVHIKGKLRYMPPEQLRGNARRASVDLFAVGAILHELLEGRRFRSQVPDEARLYGMILDGEVPPLELPGGHTLPRELEEARSGLLAANWEERIPSAKDALRLLYRWPGYRNCSLDLEELVQRFAGTEAPRTSMAAPVPANLGAPPAYASSPSAAQPSASASQPSAADSASQQTLPTQDGASVITARTGDPEPPARPLGLQLGIAGLVVLAFGIGLGGVGYGLGWFGGSEDPPPAEASTEDPAIAKVEDAPTSTPTESTGAPLLAEQPPAEQPPAEQPPAEPAPAEQAPAEQAPPPAEPPSEDEASESSDEPKASAKPNVDVQILANDYFYVEVKIAGRVYKAGPIAKAKIRAGTHAVYLREHADHPWKRAGKVTLQPGQTNVIEMLNPPGNRTSRK